MTAIPAHSLAEREFRHDINALRAWAVIAVVLFHFGVPGFSGGFVGVDVFFVISGYLMTRIIMEGVAAGRRDNGFSLGEFYLARARRIMPALLVVILALCITGWFLLASADYRMLGSHSVYAALFWSNVKFWREAGYFDAASSDKWLLHTWSLSVEWQFYLALPLLVLVAWRLVPRPGAIAALFLAGTIVSLAVSESLARREGSAAFYLIHSRAWEMLAGGLVYFAGNRFAMLSARPLWPALAGYAAILCAVFLFEGEQAWPGLAAALPVAGTMLVLAARLTAHPLVNNAVLQWSGTRSYSIYLWHWPVAVVPLYLGWPENLPLLLASLAVVLLLSELSYRLVEEKGRRLINRAGNRKGAFLLLGALLFTVAVASTIKDRDGFPSRLPAAVQAIEQEAENINPNRERCHGGSGNQQPDCVLGGPGIAAVMLGDSHASAIVTALQAAAPDPSRGVLSLSYTACPTIQGVHKTDRPDGCTAFNDWALAKIAALPATTPVVITNRTTAYLFGNPGAKVRPIIHFGTPHDTPDPEFLADARARMLATWCGLAAVRPVYLVQPLPEMPRDVPDAMARGLMHGHAVQVATGSDAYHERHAFVRELQAQAARECGVRLLDPEPLLCHDGKCSGDLEGRPLYSDDNHLSEYGNRLLVPMFRPVFGVATTP
ncbi:MAG: acyltransferase family protein [Pseudomonadota bacterium]